MPESNRKSGITLVVVLGFLAILAVLAVSLAVTMRVERLAVASYSDTTRARHLTYAALARALDDIDVKSLDVRYPPSTLKLSAGSSSITTNFFGDEADKFIPTSVYPAPLPSTIPMANVVVGTTTGRIGYYAVNCSGLLDANTAAWDARALGRKGTEISLSSSILPELQNASEFVNRRSTVWRRFETLPELYELGKEAQVLASFPINLFTYSLFRPDLDPEGNPKVWLGGTDADMDDPTNRAVIVAALVKSGIDASVADKVMDNLLDYIDTDDIPNHPNNNAALDSFNTEAVPMINEIIFSNTITRVDIGSGNIQYTHRLYCTIEVWYPFPGPYTGPQLTLSPSPPPITFLGNPATFMPGPGDLKQSGSPILTPTPFSFQTVTYMYEKVSTNQTFFTGGPVNNGVVMAPKLSAAIEVQAGGTPVDRVAVAWPNNAHQWFVNNIPSGPNPAGGGAGRSVVDPRFNYDISRWELTAMTPSNVNANATATVGEGVSSMYVRNFRLDQPKAGVGLGSVAELGYLSVGQPWRTIALYNTPGVPVHRVLDYFTASTNTLYQGRVNINSSNTEVLASALFELPVDAYPGGDGPKMSIAGAELLASNVVARLGIGNRAATNRSVSVLGEFDTSFCTALNGTLTSPAATNDARREALIRNAWQLFGYRQNLYTVFLYGQALTAGGIVGAEQRAVAVVWRDPEEDTADTGDTAPNDKLNRTFVRFFKWL